MKLEVWGQDSTHIRHFKSFRLRSSGDCSASQLIEKTETLKLMMLTSSQWPGVLIFVSKQHMYVFVLMIDCTLLLMFCLWFVTLWKSSFP